MVRLRVRGPEGTSTLTLPDSTTVGELKAEIVSKTNVSAFDLKKGYPPQPLDLDSYDSATALSDTDLKLNGEQLMVLPKPQNATERAQPAQSISSAAAPAPTRHQAAPKPHAPPPAPSNNAADDPPELPLAKHGGTLVMRVMPDDNSCLFRAVSSAAFGTEIEAMHELRSLVADRILAEPDKYTAAILDKEPAAYCRWIKTDDAWGGAIELGILAEHLGIEIASISVRDGRVDRFNEGAPRRAILVYSQIHYDVLAVSRGDSLGLGFRRPPEHDEKLFDVDDDEVLARALELGEILRERKYFTDTQSFRIRCGDCGWMGNGEMAAVKHAEATGHGNFGEASD